MGQCHGKCVEGHKIVAQNAVTVPSEDQPSSTPSHYLYNTCSHTASPLTSPLPIGASPSPARVTPRRFFRRPFPPPSPAKHIYSSLVKRHGVPKGKEASVPEVAPLEGEKPLDKSFGYSKNFGAKYELGQEVGRGHFGRTCSAKVCQGELKGQSVAVKIISKEKMTTAIAIEDVRREVKILKALSGHHNLVIFHDVCEDDNYVYIIMEFCKGGELLDRILSSGGRFSEEDAKGIVVQILSVVAFCHLQGVVHRDLKPEALVKSLSEDELVYLRAQFKLLQPDNDARISLENFKSALMRNSTEAMKESKVPDILNSMNLLAFKKINFEEFCAAATNVYQLEALDHWEEVARSAFAFFEQQGNRVISVEELAQELNLGPNAYVALHDWIRHTDGKLSFFGFTKFLHGVTLRSNRRTHCLRF